MTSLRTLDLFCGCGGMTEGLSMSSHGATRFSCAGAMDIWPAACEAFQANHEAPVMEAGVSRENVAKLLEQIGHIDILTGGPPCQGFSTSGKRMLDDPRNQLVKAYLDAVELASPKAFIMENVHGFTTMQDGKIMAEVLEQAQTLGYRVFPGVVQASLVGVPQRRRRFILVGMKHGEFWFPGTSQALQEANRAGAYSLFGRKDTFLQVDQQGWDGTETWSFDDATSDLPPVTAGESSDEYLCDPQNPLQKYFRKGMRGKLADHVAASHNPNFVQMMSYIPQGKSALDPDIAKTIPEAIRPTTGYPNSYSRILGKKPAPTITRNFTTPSSANCIHPTQNRAMTIREGARCQSFRDAYRFTGSLGDKRLLIGNSVPPLLAKSLGEALLIALQSAACTAQAA